MANTLLCCLLLAGCDPEGVHAPTNTYRNGDTVMATTGNDPAFAVQEYRFSLQRVSEEPQCSGKLVFELTGWSRNSEPDVQLLAEYVRLRIGSRELPPLGSTASRPLRGTVNPRNGETRFDPLRLEFACPPELHWGEKIVERRVRQQLQEISGFELLLPLSVPQFDYRPAFQRDGRQPSSRLLDARFRWVREEIPGQPWVDLRGLLR